MRPVPFALAHGDWCSHLTAEQSSDTLSKLFGDVERFELAAILNEDIKTKRFRGSQIPSVCQFALSRAKFITRADQDSLAGSPKRLSAHLIPRRFQR